MNRINLTNIRLVYCRELCDQWRDRRTLFTIVVIPLILYPLMGMALLQTAQFMQPEPARILWLDQAELPAEPPLLVDGALAPGLLPEKSGPHPLICIPADQDRRLRELLKDMPAQGSPGQPNRIDIQRAMQAGGYDLVVRPASRPGELQLIVNSARDRSTLAVATVTRIIDRWNARALQQRLARLQTGSTPFQGMELATTDVASAGKRQAAIWAKLLPFIVLVWALTGAFYPAIDLCAGEKERGTLETLLSSPARRGEIVAGKLLTVTTFSVATALLNLLSMTVTGLFVVGQLSRAAAGHLPLDLGFPPLSSIPWLIAGLLPISALFSSLALALACFARSAREGQYYLVPLLMSLLPLMMLSMLPAAELDLGTSLIPVTGMLLLLRNLMTGEYTTALQYAGPVLAITLVGCWLAARWAVHQFNNESVLFRSGERFGLASWLRHLHRDRGRLPTLGEAVLCGVIILVIKFFVGLSADLSLTFSGFARQIVVSQVATIALPAILMALFLTRGPAQSLKLRWPRASWIPAAILIALLLHPGFVAVSQLVMQLYPPSAGLQGLETAVSRILADAPGPLAIILVIAIVPALCEEVAFRGFILSGLESLKGRGTAILGSAVLFGIAHGILQQSIMATLFGVVVGVIAVQTGSLLPCIACHATHNALPVLISLVPPAALDQSWMGYFLQSGPEGAVTWTPLATVLMPLAGLALLVWLWRFAHRLQLGASPILPVRRLAGSALPR